jgi:hypothetical protein
MQDLLHKLWVVQRIPEQVWLKMRLPKWNPLLLVDHQLHQLVELLIIIKEL